mmetsp:Transcript_47461/g.101512  ORF Transcript_47461/g.101512 Transcript_47461/m.101512 type:complete len:229 (-) Transcript_47461:2807-3493(-)
MRKAQGMPPHCQNYCDLADLDGHKGERLRTAGPTCSAGGSGGQDGTSRGLRAIGCVACRLPAVVLSSFCVRAVTKQGIAAVFPGPRGLRPETLIVKLDTCETTSAFMAPLIKHLAVAFPVGSARTMEGSRIHDEILVRRQHTCELAGGVAGIKFPSDCASLDLSGKDETDISVDPESQNATNDGWKEADMWQPSPKKHGLRDDHISLGLPGRHSHDVVLGWFESERHE